MFTIGFHGCSHLGYQTPRMNRTANGLNLREHDGYIAHNLIYTSMLEEHQVDAIIDGGDLFHTHQPSVRSVNEARKTDDKRLASPKRPQRITNGGNHDNGASSRISAVSQIHRAHLGSHAVFPESRKNPEEQVGPYPGYYEVHQLHPELEVYAHVISHNGLDPQLEERGITIDPQPIDGAVNILCSHGIFSADGRLFGASDRHGADRVIPEEWANRGWDAVMLSDYHTPGPIPGFGPADGRERGQVWMTGSAVRRGFSDEASPRGWLKLTLHDNGTITIELVPIWQRPQVDFPPIDARTMSAEEIDQEVRKRLATQDMWDDETAELTGDGGFILRQVISHTTPHQRRALANARAEWATAAADAAYWSADYTKQTSTTAIDDPQDDDEAKPTRMAAPQSVNLHKVFAQRLETGLVGSTLKAIKANDETIHESVVKRVSDTLAGIH